MQRASWVGLVTRVLLVSLQDSPAPALPNLIFGLVALVAGAIVVKLRERIYRATTREEKRFFSRGFGELLGRLQSPFWVGVAGVFGVLMGVVMIGYSVSRFMSMMVP